MLRRSFNLGVTGQSGRMVGDELYRIDTQFRRRMRQWLALFAAIWIVSAIFFVVALWGRPAYASEGQPASAPVIIINQIHQPPQQALPLGARRWRADLVRAAYNTWGLDAPVPVFAAQVHQESTWRSDRVSRVGAVGMGQFMPETASWWCRANRMTAEQCRPRNPVWSLRALVGYDKWIWDQIGRIHGADEMDQFSRMWGTLRAYNGGLGNWKAEAHRAGSLDRLAVDAACGRARRHRSHCPENLGYPQRIMVELQPAYAAWGPLIELAASGGER